MKLDDTLIRILEQIKEEVKVKYNLTIGIEEVHQVINVQIEATKLGFIKGISVTWSKFCKFIYTERYNRKIDTINKLNKIDLDSPDLSLEEKLKLREEIILQSYIKKTSYIKTKKKELKGKEVLTSKSINKTKLTLFKNITE